MKTNHLFWSRTSKSYDIRHDVPIIHYLRKEEQKIILREIKKTDLIADLGCGTGWPSLILYSKRYKVIAFDFSDEFLNILRNKNKKIPLVKWDLTKSFEEKFHNRFDVVVSCLSFLNYVANWKAAIKNISKILKRKAKVIISIAIYKEARFKKIRTDGKKLIIYEFNLRDIIKEFEKYNFKVKKIKYLFRFIGPRWGDFKKLSFKEKTLLFIERVLSIYKDKAKIAILVFERK